MDNNIVTNKMDEHDLLQKATTTSRKVKIVLHSILQYAVEQHITKSNPCIGAIWKKEEEEGNPKYLSIQQGKALVKLMEEYSVFNTIVKVLLLTGMRSGECLGLRWDCINSEDKTITVNRTLAYANNRWYLDSPKSKNSRRTFEFDDKLYEILLKHKEEQDKAKEIVGDCWRLLEMHGSNLIWSSPHALVTDMTEVF